MLQVLIYYYDCRCASDISGCGPEGRGSGLGTASAMACSANHSKGSGHGSSSQHGSGLIVGPNAWLQRKVHLRPQHRGVHLVTDEILRGVSHDTRMMVSPHVSCHIMLQLPELAQFSVGLMHIQLLHTSASLAINENWDPDVRDDMEMMLNRIVPEDLPFRHSCEGPDDMVSGH